MENCHSQENICIVLIALMSISYRGKSSSKIYFKAKLDCWYGYDAFASRLMGLLEEYVLYIQVDKML